MKVLDRATWAWDAKRNFNEADVTPDDIPPSKPLENKRYLSDTYVVCDELRVANKDFSVVKNDMRGGPQ